MYSMATLMILLSLTVTFGALYLVLKKLGL